MKYERLRKSGAGYVDVNIAPLDGKTMETVPFLIDTGATQTTIPKSTLITLGYTDEWMSQNKILLSEDEKPLIADGSRMDAYCIPAMRLTIAGHEILHNGYFLTSDYATKLSFLLGTDILSYFDIFFKYSEWRVYYEFRTDRVAVPPTRGDNFAYKTK